MNRRLSILLLLLSLAGAERCAAQGPALSGSPSRPQKEMRGLTSLSNVFVPKGQWVTGLNASFSTHDNSNYTLVVIEGIESEGHTIKISPLLGYAVADNMVVGGKFGYSRTFLRLDGGGFSMGGGDTGIELKSIPTMRSNICMKVPCSGGNTSRSATTNVSPFSARYS